MFNENHMNDVFKNEIKTWLVDSANAIYYTQFGADIQNTSSTFADNTATDWTVAPKYYDSCSSDTTRAARRLTGELETDRALCQYDPCSSNSVLPFNISGINVDMPMGTEIEIEESKNAITGINFTKINRNGVTQSRLIDRYEANPKLCNFEEEKAESTFKNTVGISTTGFKFEMTQGGGHEKEDEFPNAGDIIWVSEVFHNDYPAYSHHNDWTEEDKSYPSLCKWQIEFFYPEE